MITRVYALIFDDDSRRFLFNRKDALLPSKLSAYEGLIGLFGGAIKEGETPLEAIRRELAEEIPGITFNLKESESELFAISEEESAQIFLLRYDLSGDNKSAPSVHRIRRAITEGGEGEPMLVSYGWLYRQPKEAFLPGVFLISRLMVAIQ